MREPSITPLVQPQGVRFLRSINIARDFTDPGALQSYVLTPFAQDTLTRLSAAFGSRSTQRAWRITGDFGSGKSSFALLLARLCADGPAALPKPIQGRIPQDSSKWPRLMPVLISGTREPLSCSIVRSLYQTVKAQRRSGPTPAILVRLESLNEAASRGSVPDQLVLEALSAVVDYVRATDKASGVLLILDELGKSLEFAALYPGRQDILLLQQIAEIASGSGTSPIVVVGLLHQGFSAYSESLSQPAQREWEKVAGRYDEILFHQPLEQIAHLVAESLQVQTTRLSAQLVERTQSEMDATVDLGWFGASVNKKELRQLAPRLFPLHPTVIPAAVRLFRRFGQNERSLFSLLLSNEPHGIQDFSIGSESKDGFYGLPHLFDYTRSTFGYKLGLQSYRSHWNLIESMVAGFQGEAIDFDLMKAVGLLSLLDAPSLAATVDSLTVALNKPANQARKIREALAKLEHKRHVLYSRGRDRVYCLWPNTSVNLETAYADAQNALPPPRSVGRLLREFLAPRPLVARRHYVQTGNLRHFSVEYVPVEELAQTLGADFVEATDGRIVVAMCETQEQRSECLELACSPELAKRPWLLFAVPEPLGSLRGLVHEVQKWQWIANNTPELAHDTYAAEEVSRQVQGAHVALHNTLLQYIGVGTVGQDLGLKWFASGQDLSIRDGRELLHRISDICDSVYCDAPRIHNELVNRRQLSSAAAAARLRLIERLLEHPESARLGMGEQKKPPEMSMYLSVLRRANLHRSSPQGWELTRPSGGDDVCNVGRALDKLKDLLSLHEGQRIRVSDLSAQLRLPPFGIRDGLFYLLFAVFVKIYDQEVALYEDGGFIPSVSGGEFQRMVKAPESFEAQFYRIDPARTELYKRLASILLLSRADRRDLDLLDVVKPLCELVANLPAFAIKTKTLPKTAQEIRACLIGAKEPGRLLFEDLPAALNCPIDERASRTVISRYVARLKESLDDLQAAYPSLLVSVERCLGQEFSLFARNQEGRRELQDRAQALLPAVREPRLKAFLLRLTDESLEHAAWIESIASFVSDIPPAKWTDEAFERFVVELGQLALTFKRTEAVLFSRRKSSEPAMRLAITQTDGSERERVFHIPSQTPEVKALERQFSEWLRASPSDRLPVALKVIWGKLGDSN